MTDVNSHGDGNNAAATEALQDAVAVVAALTLQETASDKQEKMAPQQQKEYQLEATTKEVHFQDGGKANDAVKQQLAAATQSVLDKEAADCDLTHSSDTSQSMKNAFTEVVKERQVGDMLEEIVAAELGKDELQKQEGSVSPNLSLSETKMEKEIVIDRQHSKSFSNRRKENRQAKAEAWVKLYDTAQSPGSPRKRTSSNGNRQLSRFRSLSSTSSSRSSLSSCSRLQRFSDESRERLSRSNKNKKGGKAKYDKDDDAANCTFEPKINSLSRNMMHGSGNFMKRFESVHESKTKALKNKRGKAEYDARVDKKVCPSCAAEQSYDEFANHKTKCRSCKIAFRPRIRWQDVSDGFLNRMESKEHQREEKLAAIESKTASPFRLLEYKAFDTEYEMVHTVCTAPLRWDEVAHGFMQRMETDAARREAKLLLSKRQAEIEQACTFMPQLETAGYDIHFDAEDSFHERMDRDAMRRQHERVTNELRAQYSYSTADKVFKSSSAWDDPSYFGPNRRNPSNRWI